MSRVRVRKKATLGLFLERIRNMAESEINANWSEIQEVLAQTPAAQPTEPWRDPNEPKALTIDEIKGMSEEQVTTYWSRVSAALEAAYPQQRKEATNE